MFQGEEVSPDAYIMGLIDPLSSTLKMLGYENNWFEKETGNLILPSPNSPEAGVESLSAVISLALGWKYLEYCDQRFRCFGGEINEKETDESSSKVKW